MVKRYRKRLSKKRAYSKKNQSRRMRSKVFLRKYKKSKKSKTRRVQKGSGWASWGCPGSIQNPNYSRAHVIPLISEMGDYNPYT